MMGLEKAFIAFNLTENCCTLDSAHIEDTTPCIIARNSPTLGIAIMDERHPAAEE